jgi:hypothetical protein
MANITVKNLVINNLCEAVTPESLVGKLSDLTEDLLNLQGGAGKKTAESFVGLCEVVFDFPGFDNLPRRI